MMSTLSMHWIYRSLNIGGRGITDLRVYQNKLLKPHSTIKMTFKLCCFVAVKSLSHVKLFAAPQTAAHQAFLSFTISWILLKLMSTESVMLSNHLTLCHPLLLLPSIFPSIRVFSNESSLHIRWPKYWSFSFSI